MPVRTGAPSGDLSRRLDRPSFDDLAGDFDEVVYGGRPASSRRCRAGPAELACRRSGGSPVTGGPTSAGAVEPHRPGQAGDDRGARRGGRHQRRAVGAALAHRRRRPRRASIVIVRHRRGRCRGMVRPADPAGSARDPLAGTDVRRALSIPPPPSSWPTRRRSLPPTPRRWPDSSPAADGSLPSANRLWCWQRGHRDRPAWVDQGETTMSPLVPVAETAAVAEVRGGGVGALEAPGPFLPVLGARGRTIAAAPRNVIVVADSTVVQNRFLAEADNAAFALAVTDGRPVVFAEAVHGYGASRGLGALPSAWKWTGGALLLAVFLGIWALASASGRPRKPGAVSRPPGAPMSTLSPWAWPERDSRRRPLRGCGPRPGADSLPARSLARDAQRRRASGRRHQRRPVGRGGRRRARRRGPDRPGPGGGPAPRSKPMTEGTREGC